MKLVKVGGAELNQIPLSWEGNLKNIINAIQKGKDQNVSILCLPELCISGYGCEDAFYAPNTHQKSIDFLFKILPHTKGMMVSVGLPLMFQNRIYNCAAIIVNGELIGFVPKKFLAGNGIHYEPRWFTPWNEGVKSTVSLQNSEMNTLGTYPIGDFIFNVGGIKIGFEICEDAWVATRPGRRLVNYGVDIILNPSASHFAFDKLEVRKRLVLEGSRSFAVGYVYSNLLGNEAGRAIYDGGVMISSVGEMLAQRERLSFEDVGVISATLDIDDIRLAQSQESWSVSIPQDLDENIIQIDFTYPNEGANKYLYDLNEGNWETSEYIKEEEFARAEALGLLDYMRKSYSKGFIVSLSGGADSSAIVSLVYLMMNLAFKELGLSGLKKKLFYFNEIQDCDSVEEMMPYMLKTAYQPTENSGKVTLNAANALAKAVHATFHVLNVNDIYKGYTSIVEEAIGRPLEWNKDDIALQNIQARVRAPSVWMLANIYGGLLVSTSNRSEAAVGYATMDGDTSGGLSPIAGIDKAFLRSWLVWLEHHGVGNEIRIPSLKAINEQQPTAELRPKESKQTDEDDLMPYDVLDMIEGFAIRDKKNPVDCYHLLKIHFQDVENEVIKGWVKKFFTLWSRNQWKRERYAPSFHLDDKNLDPKTWCRFPILSGSFHLELLELENV